MAAKKGKTAPARKGPARGTAVGFKYRGAKSPHGTVVGQVPGGTKNDPMMAVRPAKDSRHPGEPKAIHRRASKLHGL